MKKTVKLLLVFVLVNFAFVGYALAAKVNVTGHDDPLDEKDKIKDNNKVNLEVGNHAYITLPDGSKAYCVDPGQGGLAGAGQCTPTVLDDKDEFTKSAKYIFTNGNGDAELGNALRISGVASGYSNAKESDNIECAYIGAAASAAKGTNYKFSDSTTSSWGSTCSNISMSGTGVKLAGQALDSTTTPTTSTTGGKPTYKIEEKKDKLVVTIVNNTDVNIEINTTCVEATGCQNTTLAPKKTLKLTIKSTSSDCATIPSYFSGEIKYTPSGGGAVTPPGGSSKECTEVTVYKCAAGLQRYIACSNWDSGTPAGGGGTPSTGGEQVITMEHGGTDQIPVPCDPTIPPASDPCPFDKDDYVQELPGDGLGDREKDAMCDTAIDKLLIDQATKVNKDDKLINDCGYLDENRITTSPSGFNPYCRDWYCVEDYTFNTPPVALEIAQKNITSGTFFSFVQPELKDQTHVICYSKNHLDDLKDNIKAAMAYGSDYNDYEKGEYTCTPQHHCNTCQYTETDADGNPKTVTGASCAHCGEYWTHTETLTLTHYYGKVDSDTFTYSWDKATSSSSTSGNGATCPHSSADNYTKGSIKMNALKTEYVDKQIEEFMKCTDFDLNTMLAFNNECKRTLQFNYYDGKEFNITPVNLKTNTSSNISTTKVEGNYFCPVSTSNLAPGSRDGCHDSAGSKAVKVSTPPEGGSGSAISVSIPTAATHTTLSIDVENTYKINGVDIYNDYSAQTRCFDTAIYDKTGLGGYGLSLCPNVDTTQNGWPVSYKTQHGLYRYSFDIKDINSCISNNTQDFGLGTTDNHYNIDCIYEVNGCKTCDHWCDDTDAPGVCGPDECVECMYDCVGAGCLYDEEGGLATQYKPISLINIDEAFVYMNMNQGGVAKLLSTKQDLESKIVKVKPLSASDSIDLSKSRNWNTEKGKETIDDMIDTRNGEEIYAGDPQYRIVLTPQLIKEIQTDNATSGYLGNMTCNLEGPATDKYVTCKSDYLEYLRGKGLEGTTTFEKWSGTLDFDKNLGPAWK